MRPGSSHEHYRRKDYLATVEPHPDAGLFHGEVINTRAVLTFQGRSIDELTTAFAETIRTMKTGAANTARSQKNPIRVHLRFGCRRNFIGASQRRPQSRQEPERDYQGNLGARHITPLPTEIQFRHRVCDGWMTGGGFRHAGKALRLIRHRSSGDREAAPGIARVLAKKDRESGYCFASFIRGSASSPNFRRSSHDRSGYCRIIGGGCFEHGG